MSDQMAWVLGERWSDEEIARIKALSPFVSGGGYTLRMQLPAGSIKAPMARGPWVRGMRRWGGAFAPMSLPAPDDGRDDGPAPAEDDKG